MLPVVPKLTLKENLGTNRTFRRSRAAERLGNAVGAEWRGWNAIIALSIGGAGLAEAELALAQVTDPSMRMSLHGVVAGYLSLARHAEARDQRVIAATLPEGIRIRFCTTELRCVSDAPRRSLLRVILLRQRWRGESACSGALAMKARRLIDRGAFGPETLKAMAQAFDQAWAEIAGNFGSDPVQVENARLMLAEALLSVVTESSTDVDALKRGALQAVGLGSR